MPTATTAAIYMDHLTIEIMPALVLTPAVRYPLARPTNPARGEHLPAHILDSPHSYATGVPRGDKKNQGVTNGNCP